MVAGGAKRELFLKTVSDWQAIEADTCERIDELIKKVKSPLIMMTLDIMK